MGRIVLVVFVDYIEVIRNIVFKLDNFRLFKIVIKMRFIKDIK